MANVCTSNPEERNDSIDLVHTEFGVEQSDRAGNFVAQFYGDRSFRDDLRHKRTYWQYGHIISYIMECVRIYVEEEAHDRYLRDQT